MSNRTLKRRLAASGKSFRSVLDELRTETAMLLLRTGEFSMDEVAERLGFADASGFGKAFRRWTGVSPAVFQRSGGSPGPDRPDEGPD